MLPAGAGVKLIKLLQGFCLNHRVKVQNLFDYYKGVACRMFEIYKHPFE
jgi:hypothetical protein